MSGKADENEKGEASSDTSAPYKVSTEFSLG